MTTAQEILADIERRLTGDRDFDVAFLQDKSDYYYGQEDGQQIVLGIMRMMLPLVDEAQREEGERLLFIAEHSLQEDLRIVTHLYEAGQLSEAKAWLDALVENIEDRDFMDEDLVVYRSFENMLEHALYVIGMETDVQIKNPLGNVHEVYRMHGLVLDAVGDHRLAGQSFRKAIHWNPVHGKTWLDYAAHLRNLGKLEKALDAARRGYQYALGKEDLMRACKEAAYYYKRKNQLPEALLYFSASQSLQMANDLKEAGVKELDESQKDKVFVKTGIGDKANPDVLATAKEIGRICLESGDYENAVDLLALVDDLEPSVENESLLMEAREKAMAMP